MLNWNRVSAKAVGGRTDDRGITLVIVTLALVMLLVVAALALDLGAVYNERRIDQNSADAAAMSGLVQLVRGDTTQEVVTEVLAKVVTDLERPVALSDWTSCTDPNALTYTAAELSLTPATQCISFSNTFERIRVRVPDQDVRTTFARVIGIDSFGSSAYAEAGLFPKGGGALPFVVLAQNGAGSQICLRTDGTGGAEPPNQLDSSGAFVLDPCDEANFDAAAGARGTLEPVLYQASCSSPGNQAIIDAIMVGIDHQLGVFDPAVDLSPGDSANALDSSPGARIDGGGGCTVALPNSVSIETGLTAQLLKCALLERPCGSGSAATSGLNGRLSASGSGATFAELGVDDTPLWDFFVDTLPLTADASCTIAKVGGVSFYTRRAALIECLQQWTSGVLFTEDIVSPRLGYVPLIAEFGICDTQPDPDVETCESPDGGLDHAHINSFAPVYIDGLYQYANTMPACDTANPATPPGYTGWAIHYPGNGYDCGDSSGTDVVHRVSGIVLPCGALPATVCDPSNNPPFPGAEGITNLQLVK